MSLYNWTLRVMLPGWSQATGPEKVSVDYLKDFRVAVAPPGHLSREAFDAVWRTADRVMLDNVLEVEDQRLLISLVGTRDSETEKDFAAVLPDDAIGVPGAEFGPRIVAARGSDVNAGGRYSLYYRKPDGVLPSFLDHLEVVAHDLVQSHQEWLRSSRS